MGADAGHIARAEREASGTGAGWNASCGRRWLGWSSVLVTVLVLGSAADSASNRAARARLNATLRSSRTVEIAYASKAALRRALRRHPAELVRLVAPLRIAEVRSPGFGEVYARAVGREPGISAARLTARRRTAQAPALALGLLSTPAGGAYEWQYYVARVDHVPLSVIAAARRVTIAVVDTGADLGAPALAGKAVSTYDVQSGRPGVEDNSGHGTFVASLAAGSGGGGVAGFGGDARLLVVKVADGSTFNDVDVAAGILYAVGHGARIVNVSAAGPTPSPVEKSAIRYAVRRGALLVAAAGNDARSGNPPEYPAAYLQPIGSNGSGGFGLAVGASDLEGRRAHFSEYGSFLSLAAPGAVVFGAVSPASSVVAFPRSSLPGASSGLYGFASGTSFAAPEVAGAAALVWAANPRLTATGVATILKQTASGSGVWSPELGYGVLDVAAAVEKAIASQGRSRVEGLTAAKSPGERVTSMSSRR